MNNETGVALLGDEFEIDALSLRGLFVTKAMGDSAVYPGSRTYRQRSSGCQAAARLVPSAAIAAFKRHT